ncbi:hypothetical protein BDV09DRAFT_10627 [Aspergillus tetrazonus]
MLMKSIVKQTTRNMPEATGLWFSMFDVRLWKHGYNGVHELVRDYFELMVLQTLKPGIIAPGHSQGALKLCCLNYMNIGYPHICLRGPSRDESRQSQTSETTILALSVSPVRF